MPARHTGGRALVADARTPSLADSAHFAHESERDFAKLLDFYGISWEYEPVEFVLDWDERGLPASAFRPDFYLPDFGHFVELTTLRQGLVTKKNRKIRQMAELYPNVRVKILYRRDVIQLAVKYRAHGPSRLAG